jgi:argininosuccinate lyase
MILFSTQEYNFIHLPEAYSTGSSAMPQKMNADLLELTRAKSARVIGHATALQITLKGLPLAYNKDLQETQVPLFQAAETMLSLLPLIQGWMKAMQFNHERMQEAAQTGFLNAWAAATYLVRRGVPFRLAHEQIGKAVQLCLEKHCELRDLSLEDLRSLNPAFDQEFYACLSLQVVLGMHDVPGGTAPSRVRQAISDAKQRLDSIRGGIHAHA